MCQIQVDLLLENRLSSVRADSKKWKWIESVKFIAFHSNIKHDMRYQYKGGRLSKGLRDWISLSEREKTNQKKLKDCRKRLEETFVVIK